MHACWENVLQQGERDGDRGEVQEDHKLENHDRHDGLQVGGPLLILSLRCMNVIMFVVR